jgi:hypothetical protein
MVVLCTTEHQTVEASKYVLQLQSSGPSDEVHDVCKSTAKCLASGSTCVQFRRNRAASG